MVHDVSGGDQQAVGRYFLRSRLESLPRRPEGGTGAEQGLFTGDRVRDSQHGLLGVVHECHCVHRQYKERKLS